MATGAAATTGIGNTTETTTANNATKITTPTLCNLLRIPKSLTCSVKDKRGFKTQFWKKSASYTPKNMVVSWSLKGKGNS